MVCQKCDQPSSLTLLSATASFRHLTTPWGRWRDPFGSVLFAKAWNCLSARQTSSPLFLDNPDRAKSPRSGDPTREAALGGGALPLPPRSQGNMSGMNSLSPQRLPGTLWEVGRGSETVLTCRCAKSLSSSRHHTLPRTLTPHKPLYPKR